MTVVAERRPLSVEARGITRRDINKLKSIVGLPPEDSPLAFYKMAVDTTQPVFSIRRRFTDVQVLSVRKKFGDFIDTGFWPFAHSVYRERLAGLENVVSTVHAYYYMQVGKYLLTKKQTREEFAEDNIEMRFTRFSVDRKRTLIDDVGCNVSIIGHVLGRMVERGRIMDPLDYLRANAFRILPFVSLYCVRPEWAGDIKRVAIPLADGLLVGEFAVLADAKQIDDYRRRFRIDRNGTNMDRIRHPNVFLGPESIQDVQVTIRISSFLDHDTLRPNQEWLRDTLKAFLDRHEDWIGNLCGLISSPNIMFAEGFVEEFIPLYREFCGILTDPRADLIDLEP